MNGDIDLPATLPSSVLGILMREGPTFPLGDSPMKHRSKKMLALMVDHFQVLGGTRCSISEMARGPSHSHPFRQQLHEQGTVHTPIPSRVPSPPCLPPVSACLLLTWSLPADSSRCLSRSACPSLSLCYLYPPTSLSFHLPATLPVHAPAVHMSCCPPVSLLLSVCPRPAADTAFNSLCPSPCCFSGLREGARKSWGGAPSNPRKTLLG